MAENTSKNSAFLPPDDARLKLDHTKLGARIAEQAREHAREEIAKKAAFARGTRRHTEGK